MHKIQVGFLVSYDYELLKNAIPQIYSEADTIFLAIDQDKKTWNGEIFIIADEFFQWLTSIDKDRKIEIYEDNFFRPELSAMQCEVRERKLLSEKMGIGNWLIQLDADEYFINFNSFVEFLKSKNKYLENPRKTPVQIAPFLINMYKKVEGGYLYVKKTSKVIAVTNYPNYKTGRNTKEQIIYNDALILHECLSRTKEELVCKFNNWGHNVDINPVEFIEKWESVNADNYRDMSNFFYLEPHKWKLLEFVKGNKLCEFFENIQEHADLKPSTTFILKKNFGQWFKHFIKKRILIIKGLRNENSIVDFDL